MGKLRWAVLFVVFAACSGGSETAPRILSFTTFPSVVIADVPTSFTFTFVLDSNDQVPVCQIDGVGDVTSGSQTMLTLSSDTTFTLHCMNGDGDATATSIVTVTALPIAPALATFTANPTTVVVGTPTDVTFSWTFATTATPAPDCTIDQGVGAITSGETRSVTQTSTRTYTLTCTNAGGSDSRQLTIDTAGAPVAPTIGTFTATPASATNGVPTNITWTWTYSNSPTPAPTCSINNSVGTVTSGAMTSVTLTTATTYTLTCTNGGGTGTKQATVSVAAVPVAPALATFTATPSTVTSGVATNVTWQWTYSNAPTPTPSCTVDNGVGTIGSGTVTTVNITQNTTYTLTCMNSAGMATRMTSITVTPPVAPAIATFTATPSSVTSGLSTSVTFNWTYANSPAPAPTCSINNGIGAIASGSSAFVNLTADTTYTLTCMNAAGTDTKQLTITVTPPVAPIIGTFTATPNYVASGTNTYVGWSWTYANTPSPPPTCGLDHALGGVVNGQVLGITITTDTTYTLTCQNSAGQNSAQVTVKISTPPVLAGFTVTPSTVSVNTPTTATWNWSYSNTPVPTPTCMITPGVSVTTPGGTSSITLSRARTYRLRCGNQGGIVVADVTVGVDECAANLDDCGANTDCIDTAESFSCACSTGYTGDGTTCSKLQACNTTPSLCDPHATCTNTANGYACTCNTGYVGDGATCQRYRYEFVTSTTGTGNLATWAGAGGQTGIAAADAICSARAAAAGLPGTYVAWISDAVNDAYCRVQGYAGKKSAVCGLSNGTLPVAAGPWARRDGVRWAGTIDRLVSPYSELYSQGNLDENGVAVPTTDLVFTGTGADGAFKASGAADSCSSWTSASTSDAAITGQAGAGSGYFSDQLAATNCDQLARLRCLEVGTGPAFPPHQVLPKRVFATSVSGNGILGAWPDIAGLGLTGAAAADAICQARARYIGVANAASFRAFVSTSSSTAASRITGNGPWFKLDGLPVAFSKTDLLDGQLFSPINRTELLGTPTSGFNGAWTGSTTAGINGSYTCGNWTVGVGGTYGGTGKHDSFTSWVQSGITSCNTSEVLYCFEN
ncbi:MAG TPA: EGF domain-containing protein [Kofleriaceae bacterium]|nr:EGF domain-containing protein [Kofleriaceae bacterium]